MHIIYYIATRHFPTVSHIFSRHDRFGARPKSADHSRARAHALTYSSEVMVKVNVSAMNEYQQCALWINVLAVFNDWASEQAAECCWFSGRCQS